MKKKNIFFAFAALLAAFLLASCEMTYGENEYDELVQYYCCWGDDDWHEHDEPSLTLMIYEDNVYTIEIETEKKNQRFEITKGSGYSIEYMSDYADADTAATYTKTQDNGFGGKQTVLVNPGTYKISFDPDTETYSVTEK